MVGQRDQAPLLWWPLDRCGRTDTGRAPRQEPPEGGPWSSNILDPSAAAPKSVAALLQSTNSLEALRRSNCSAVAYLTTHTTTYTPSRYEAQLPSFVSSASSTGKCINCGRSTSAKRPRQRSTIFLVRSGKCFRYGAHTSQRALSRAVQTARSPTRSIWFGKRLVLLYRKRHGPRGCRAQRIYDSRLLRDLT